MVQDSKNPANSQVTKANASELERTISDNCQLYPLQVGYKETGESYPNTLENQEFDTYNIPIGTFTWTYNQQKYSFIYYVIKNGLYHLKEGKKLRVNADTINEVFTKLIYSLQIIETFTERTAFDAYLYQEWQQVLQDEEQERLNYHNAPLLQKLMKHHSTPKLIQRDLIAKEKQIRQISYSISTLFDELKRKALSLSEFDEQRQLLDRNLEKCREKQTYLAQKYKSLVESTKYRRRKLLKMCFSTDQLDHACKGLDIQVECRTLSVCTFYINEYCKWYNHTFKAEIALTDKERRKQKRSLRKKTTPSLREQRLEVLRPYLDTDLSYGKIAQATGIPKSTVQDLLKSMV